MSDAVQTIWVDMAKQHDNTIDEDEIEVFISMVLNLSPRQDVKQFLNYQFNTSEKLRDSKKSALLMAVLELYKKLNDMLGTTATATRDSIANVMVKPLRTKTVKAERDKAKPKVLKKLKNRAKWNRRKVAV